MTKYWVHHINAVVFIYDGMAYTWYWVFYPVGLLLTLMVALILRQKRLTQIAPVDLIVGPLFIFFCIVAGARLAQVFIYSWGYFRDHIGEVPLIFNGGMSVHGGFAGAALGIFGYAKLRRLSALELLDVVATTGPLPLMLGRFGNFLQGELPGRITDVPWAIIYSNYGTEPRHPATLYESFLEGFILFCLMWSTRRRILERPGYQVCQFLVGYSVIRFLLEFVKEPEQNGIIFGILTIGQVLSLLVIAIVIFVAKYSATRTEGETNAHT